MLTNIIQINQAGIHKFTFKRIDEDHQINLLFNTLF